MKRVVIVGGGFAGINAAKGLGGVRDIEVTLIDQRNHHLFQPLLYQVAMAGLSPADIAAPIRAMLSRYSNIRVLLGSVESVDLNGKTVTADIGSFPFDDLILACGATHSYFGHDNWEEFAPGLKTLEQATEIRRRVLTAFENAERATDPEERRRFLTFVVVGGGPTGVELAGAIGEMSRFTLAKDFRSIDAKSAKVILVEAGARILPSFSEPQAAQAARDLVRLGVEVRTSCSVTWIDGEGVQTAERSPSSWNRALGSGSEGFTAGESSGTGVRCAGPCHRCLGSQRRGTPERIYCGRSGEIHASNRKTAAWHGSGRDAAGTIPCRNDRSRHEGRAA